MEFNYSINILRNKFCANFDPKNQFLWFFNVQDDIFNYTLCILNFIIYLDIDFNNLQNSLPVFKIYPYIRREYIIKDNFYGIIDYKLFNIYNVDCNIENYCDIIKNYINSSLPSIDIDNNKYLFPSEIEIKSGFCSEKEMNHLVRNDKTETGILYRYVKPFLTYYNQYVLLQHYYYYINYICLSLIHKIDYIKKQIDNLDREIDMKYRRLQSYDIQQENSDFENEINNVIKNETDRCKMIIDNISSDNGYTSIINCCDQYISSATKKNKILICKSYLNN